MTCQRNNEDPKEDRKDPKEVGQAPGEECFRPEDRLKRQADFDRVYARDVFAADEVLVVKGCENGDLRVRLGLSVSRKVGSAVERNRCKRIIREVFRRIKNKLPHGIDLVVRPRKGAALDYDAIARSLPRLAARIDQKLEKSTPPQAAVGPRSRRSKARGRKRAQSKGRPKQGER